MIIAGYNVWEELMASYRFAWIPQLARFPWSARVTLKVKCSVIQTVSKHNQPTVSPSPVMSYTSTAFISRFYTENVGGCTVSFLVDTSQFFRCRIMFCYTQEYRKVSKMPKKVNVKCFYLTRIWEDSSLYTILTIYVFPLPFSPPVYLLEPFYLTLTLFKL